MDSFDKVNFIINRGEQLKKEKKTLDNIEQVIQMIDYQIKNPQTYTHGKISICCEYTSFSDVLRNHEIKISGLDWQSIKLILEKRKNEIVEKFNKIEKMAQQYYI